MSRSTLSDLKSLFRFPFQGPDWASRFIIGCALFIASYIIPIVPMLFAYGYVVEVMRRVIRGEEPGLPPWEDWGRLLMDGLRAFAVGLAYLLPGTLVYFGSVGLYFAGFFVPLSLGMEDQEVFWFVMGAMVLLFLGIFLSFLLYFLGAIPLPAALAHFVAEDRLGAAFQVRRWWAVLKERRWEYAIAWLLLFGLMGIMWFAVMLLYYSLCLCWLIPIAIVPVSFYVTLVAGVLFAMVWRDYGVRSTE